MDHASASLGTIGVTANLKGGTDITRPGILTTPGPVVLHSELAELEACGVTHLALEASSMGLDQYRLDGLRLTAAGFTNLTRDHLDYHGTMEKYFESKRRIFTELLPRSGVAVVNMDTPYSARLAEDIEAREIRLIGVGRQGREIKLNRLQPLPTGQYVDFEIFGERYALELPLVGDFQAMNALLALGLVIAEDPDDRSLHMQGAHALERLQSVRGRLEFAGATPGGAGIYIDYAHTPDGLETMLKALRPHTQKKLHVVFGCGGDRDKGKRPMMGEIAARLADHVIVTDDNPRTENAAAVRAEVMKGCPQATEIGNRREAIRTGIKALKSGDVLVIAGKGHEQGQIVGEEIHPFDDITEAKHALAEIKQ
jgi:UDP-N-acetylmuramoyl-L-alanyl-D-glutamate--2,6-diaminopimelate ligase